MTYSTRSIFVAVLVVAFASSMMVVLWRSGVNQIPVPRFGVDHESEQYARVRQTDEPVWIRDRTLFSYAPLDGWNWMYEVEHVDGREERLTDYELDQDATAKTDWDSKRQTHNASEYIKQLAEAPYGEVIEQGGTLVIRNMDIPRRTGPLNLIEHRKELPSVYILGTAVHQRYIRYWTDYGTNTPVPFPQASDNIVWRVEEPYIPKRLDAMVSLEGGPPAMEFTNITTIWEEGLPELFMYQGTQP